MAMQTGENEQALRKILDMTRLISIVFLGLHFYYYGYTAFKHWELVGEFSDAILGNIYKTGLFSHFYKSKLFALGFLFISLLGSKGRKNEKLNYKTAFLYMGLGMLSYWISYFLLMLKIEITISVILYMLVTSI